MAAKPICFAERAKSAGGIRPYGQYQTDCLSPLRAGAFARCFRENDGAPVAALMFRSASRRSMRRQRLVFDGPRPDVR